jgi:hypothetical protein
LAQFGFNPLSRRGKFLARVGDVGHRPAGAVFQRLQRRSFERLFVRARTSKRATEDDETRVKELELKIRDLEITNRVKDQFIGMKDKFIEQLQQEQRNIIERLIDSSHRIGQLEIKLDIPGISWLPKLRHLTET